jgi:hypothetical protein
VQYKGLEYSVVQLADGSGWRWEVTFADGKHRYGVTPVSRAVAIKTGQTRDRARPKGPEVNRERLFQELDVAVSLGGTRRGFVRVPRT